MVKGKQDNYTFLTNMYAAAKRKVLDLYNQFKASRNNNSFNSNPSAGGSSIPTTNAHYK